jgi:aspartate/methionine/tyrosine aminotransferase
MWSLPLEEWKMNNRKEVLRYFEQNKDFFESTVFPNIEKFGLTSSEFCTRMIAEGKLAAVPGSCFGAEGYIRLSYCYCDAELKTGLDRLEAFIQTLLPA